MIRALCTAALICFAVTACSETTEVSDDLPESQADTANPTGRTERAGPDPGEQPVRIGEGGPRFAACQGTGRIVRGGGLDVLSAPFDNAERKDAIPAGQLVHICSRTLDQQWMGVVYAPAFPERSDGPEISDGTIDCGVSSPVRSKRDYVGPCKSGWIESTFVKLVAG